MPKHARRGDGSWNGVPLDPAIRVWPRPKVRMCQDQACGALRASRFVEEGVTHEKSRMFTSFTNTHAFSRACSRGISEDACGVGTLRMRMEW
jgi:hypothetical protein